MRSRVAAPAALVILITLIFLPIYRSMNIAEDENYNVQGKLRDIVSVVGQVTEGASLRERADEIDGLQLSNGIRYGVFDEQHTAISAPEDLIGADFSFGPQAPRVHTLDAVDGSGGQIVAAVYHYDDGSCLVLTQERKTMWKVMLHDPEMLIVGIALLIAIVLFVGIWVSIDRKERLLNSVMKTLDDVSDGNFESTVPQIPGKSADVAEFNAILGRLNSRVFQQRTRNQAMSTVLTQMQNGIIAVDQNLHVMLVTALAKRLLGIHGNPEGQLVTEVSKDVHLEDIFYEAMQQNGVYTNEVAARSSVGRGHRPLRLYVSPMRADGKLVGALAMVEDITELKRLEQARTDFAANVSHELKTPLTSIRGFVETLEAGAIDNPEMAHKFLRIIMLETERLTRLINDILSISKLESGEDEVAIERIRLDKMANDVCEMLSIHAGEKDVTVISHENEHPTWIMGNPDRVEQMLINLVENAIKYNKPGGSVTVQVFSNEKEANVTISDTGIGIQEEHLPRLFERFYRVDKGRSRQMGGTGLGLAIVKHIVHSMNGEIEVHSKYGEGTEFLITLPLAPVNDPDKDTIFNDD